MISVLQLICISVTDIPRVCFDANYPKKFKNFRAKPTNFFKAISPARANSVIRTLTVWLEEDVQTYLDGSTLIPSHAMKTRAAYGPHEVRYEPIRDSTQSAMLYK